MYKRIIIILFAAILLMCSACAHGSGENSQNDVRTDRLYDTAGNVTVENEFDSQDRLLHHYEFDGDDIVLREEYEYLPDGSVRMTGLYPGGDRSLVLTAASGEVCCEIVYSASEDTTVKTERDYDQYGVLISEYVYDGAGDLLDEFAAGDYTNALGMAENNYHVYNNLTIDLERAFDPTVEQLAPLYARAREFWETYGVAVLIADKVNGDTAGAEQCFEYDRIEPCLDFIENALACYPQGFFGDFSQNGITVDVCIQLVGAGSAAGLYHGGYYQDGHEYQVVQMDVNDYTPSDEYDDKGEFLCYTLHHEILHMISSELFDRADRSECPLTEERWNSFNPVGFEYAYSDQELENELYCTGDNFLYFVYSYSCSTPDEDRATIFGQAMNYYQGYYDPDYEFSDELDAKLRYLSECIRAGFDSRNWPDKTAWEYILRSPGQ